MTVIIKTTKISMILEYRLLYISENLSLFYKISDAAFCLQVFWI